MRWLKRVGLILGLIVVILVPIGFYFLSFVQIDEADLHLSASIQHGQLQHAGRERTYLYYIPKNLVEQPALVFVLHGSQGSGRSARITYGFGFDRLADKEGFIAVYPDGYADHWNDCRRKGPYDAKRLQIDDVGFMRAIAAQLEEKYHVDAHRIFATGLSNGGQMALRLALEAPDLVRAVAPVAASLPTPDNMDCKYSGQPASFLLINGTKDPMNPFNGGKVALYGILGDRGDVISSQATVQYWAKLAGYDNAPIQNQLPDIDPNDNSVVDVSRWAAEGKKTVALYAIQNGGHNVPNPNMRYPRAIGQTNHDIDGADVIWEFFKTVP
ncbi:MAG TPA: PHB depolymerase family esterase [Spongiibacteraceae bacterium]|nr:PHB depolymerase family esterase [Spongiibacteraceae bacterium]